ncbi:hypothetical protein ACIBMX_10735 [Streptomyces phaeochromogenes]|uniref:hypothetical protein n=1 Tax=Streptomyces phaeochromogenes TaxID=1923 RepID=UPI0033E71E4A
MKNYRVKWTESGEERTSVVAYDNPSAKHRAGELEASEGITNVRVVSAKPGE